MHLEPRNIILSKLRIKKEIQIGILKHMTIQLVHVKISEMQL